jgi:hypothetical protein
MRVKLFTFRYSASLRGFDDTPLADFVRDREVVAFREHFFTVNEVPHLACVVHYQDGVVPPAAIEAAREIPRRARKDSKRNGAPDPCEGLDESERALFNTLREWRSDISRDEGLPPYLILTNKQLVAIVRKRPDSPTALGNLDGIGPGKIERYGAAILERVATNPTAVRARGVNEETPSEASRTLAQPDPGVGAMDPVAASAATPAPNSDASTPDAPVSDPPVAEVTP